MALGSGFSFLLRRGLGVGGRRQWGNTGITWGWDGHTYTHGPLTRPSLYLSLGGVNLLLLVFPSIPEFRAPSDPSPLDASEFIWLPPYHAGL